MRKITLPFFVLLLTLSATAQEHKFAISLTPALVETPVVRYGVQPGFEFFINERLSLLTEIAVGVGGEKDPYYGNSKYLRIKPELRYALGETKLGFEPYTGLQFSYSYRKWDNLSGGSFFDKDSVVNYDKASINSPILTTSIQFGTIMPISDRVKIDFFAGLGARFIFTDYSRLENPTKDSYLGPRRVCSLAPAPAYSANGTVSRFHSNLGFRLLYRF